MTKTPSVSHCSMFGAFNLRVGIEFAAFKQAFDAFSEHLCEQGYLGSWRIWERAYHEGYDTRFPDVAVILEMQFHSYESSLEAWEYIEAKSEPMLSLHVAMNRMVTDTYFVLCHER